MSSVQRIGTRYLDYLTDGFSIWQHSKGNMVDRSMGYALDDAARGLVLAVHLRRDDLVQTYYSFIQKSCSTVPPTVFYSSSREPLPGPLSADAAGQVVWALGLAKEKGYELTGSEALAKGLAEEILGWPSVRGWAYALCGTVYLDDALTERLGEQVIERVHLHASDEWYWPEDKITYGNAILPYSLIVAGERKVKESWAKAGLTMLDFLNALQYVDGKPTAVGNRGWYSKGGSMAHFDQQPIEAAYMVMANCAAYAHTHEEDYREHAFQFFLWFWGNNLGGKTMVNLSRESVYDGLWENGRSENQGAESIVCYLLAQEAITPYLTSSGRS